MRAVYLLSLLGLLAGPVGAQNQAQNATKPIADKHEKLSISEQKTDRLNQKTQRIQIEDGGSRVDELRVGGQTQSIHVQPKGGDLPAYEVQAPAGTRSTAGSASGAETSTAPRVWNVLKF